MKKDAYVYMMANHISGLIKVHLRRSCDRYGSDLVYTDATTVDSLQSLLFIVAHATNDDQLSPGKPCNSAGKALDRDVLDPNP